MSHKFSVLLAGLGLSVALQAAHAAEGETPPGVEALEEFRTGAKPPNPVQNRFFLKTKRFEVTPLLGFGPNNAFADRFPTASLGFGYHFTEQLALSGIFTYAPDLGKNDVKALVPILLNRADDPDFQQPFDKVTLAASLGVTWSPVYGKINILGETVLNFDFFAFLGVGFVLQNEYVAIENSNVPDGASLNDTFNITPGESEVRFAPAIGFGGNFFVSQTVAIRLDARFFLFPDDLPQYDPTEPVEGTRLNSFFNAAIGVAFFFPKMKPRLYDF